MAPNIHWKLLFSPSNSVAVGRITMKRRIHNYQKKDYYQKNCFSCVTWFQLDQHSRETNSSGERNLKLINMKLNNLHGTSPNRQKHVQILKTLNQYVEVWEVSNKETGTTSIDILPVTLMLLFDTLISYVWLGLCNSRVAGLPFLLLLKKLLFIMDKGLTWSLEHQYFHQLT